MSPKRKDVTPRTLAPKGVRIYLEGDRVKVQWTDPITKTRRYSTAYNTPEGRKEARAFAEGVVARLAEGKAPSARATHTLRDLWLRYRAAVQVHQRLRTRELHEYRWGKFTAFRAEVTPWYDIGPETLAQFRAELTRAGMAVKQVRSCITTVRAVFNWAERHEVIPAHRLHGYKFTVGKDERVNSPGEWSNTDWDRLLAHFGGGQDHRRWRAWALTLLLGSQGPRIRAALHLRWEDVDLDAGTIRWVAQYDKTGRARVQRLSWSGYVALLTAWRERERMDYRGPWVFWSVRRTTLAAKAREDVGALTYTTFHSQLQRACAALGIPWEKWRAAHGFRKLAATNVYAATGDAKAALDWIGDTDPARITEYVRERSEQGAATVDALDAFLATKAPQAGNSGLAMAGKTP